MVIVIVLIGCGLAGLGGLGLFSLWSSFNSVCCDFGNLSEAPKVDPAVAAALTRDLAEFQQRRNGLPPADAAREWLTFATRYPSILLAGHRSSARQDYLADWLDVLPPTNAWPELARQVTLVQASGSNHKPKLTLLAYALAGNTAGAQATLKTIDSRRRYGVAEIRQQLQAREDGLQHADALTALRRQLQTLAQTDEHGSERSFKLPDVVGLAGSDEAEQLIRQALLLPRVRLSVPVGGETLALAQREALRNLAQLPQPPWDLVRGLECQALYEALDKKFSKPAGLQIIAGLDAAPNYEQQEALQWYAAALLFQGREADAEQALLHMDRAHSSQKLPYYLEHYVGDMTRAGQIYRLLATIVQRHPELDMWNEVAGWARLAACEADWLERLRAIAATQQAGPYVKPYLQEALLSALLSADQVDEALGVLHQALLASDMVGIRRLRLALREARLGQLLQRPELITEGLNTARNAFLDDIEDSSYRLDDICTELIAAHQYDAAEKMLLQLLKRVEGNADQHNRYGQYHSASAEYLVGLVTVYHAAGRHADVLKLLEEHKGWGAADLAQLSTSRQRDSLVWLAAAEALQAAGRTTEAVPILKAALLQDPGKDAYYQALLSMTGADILPWLDQLYARDRFEERPLIWKAVVLQKMGRLEEAEQTARQALKVDPTDGEQPAGDRVRGYAVLGDILAARGHVDDATFFRNVVKSVRLAEQGDALVEAGLYKRSLPLFEQAQALFADAYCVQWRLAERLNDLGRTEEAEQHYATAFERMPEQFGQVASLCFGCEGIFDKPHSRSVAERVLTRLEQSGKVRPPLYYLLGQLREAQQRPSEAYAFYRQAVALDADYLDAWNKIHDLGEQVALPQTESDALQLRMLRLNPLGRHHSNSLDKVSDLPGLWQAVDELQPLRVSPPKVLLPLVASAAQPGQQPQPQERFDHAEESGCGMFTPGQALAKQKLVEAILNLDE
jgi:tetratricopeptide (TPR) repeat protein